jgi:hypothetical protein
MCSLRIAPNQQAALRHIDSLFPTRNFDHTFSISVVANAKVMCHFVETKDEYEKGLYTWVNLFHAAFPVSSVTFTQYENTCATTKVN